MAGLIVQNRDRVLESRTANRAKVRRKPLTPEYAARLSGLDRTRPPCGQDDVNGPVASKVSMNGRCCASLVQSCYRGWSMDEAMIPGL
jgi:hypothetical protein